MMYLQKNVTKTTTFSLREVLVVCVAKSRSFYMIQKNGLTFDFVRMRGRSHTKIERGKTTRFFARAQDTNRNNNTKISFQS